jgi:hypothetical protein
MIVRSGTLADLSRRTADDGRSWASATLLDSDGTIGMLFVPSVYALIGQYLSEGATVTVRALMGRRAGHDCLLVADIAFGADDPDAH